MASRAQAQLLPQNLHHHVVFFRIMCITQDMGTGTHPHPTTAILKHWLLRMYLIIFISLPTCSSALTDSRTRRRIYTLSADWDKFLTLAELDFNASVFCACRGTYSKFLPHLRLVLQRKLTDSRTCWKFWLLAPAWIDLWRWKNFILARICVLWTPEALFQMFYKFLTLSAWYHWSTISAGCLSQEVFNGYYDLCTTKAFILFFPHSWKENW